MNPNIVAILEDCIDRGIHNAILKFEHCIPYPAQLEEKIDHEIWRQLDRFFDFKTEIL
jgi:hypothetical protein